MKILSSRFLGLILAVAPVTVFAQANPTNYKVFQLGRFDQASSEFRGGQPSKPVVVQVGQGDADNQWFSEQPAVPQLSPHPDIAFAQRTIQFSLSSSPAPFYRLHIGFILSSRAVPALLISLNGKTGKLYLDSHLDAALKSMDDSFETALLPVEVSYEFPGSFLHKGENSLSLQVIESAPSTGMPTGLSYDAIELDSAGDAATAAAAAVVPTIFFQGQGSALKEKVDVFVHRTARTERGTQIRLTLNGVTYLDKCDTAQDFGEQRASFWVPEFAGPVNTRVEWSSEGRGQSAEQTVSPERKWTVLLVPHIHLDIGYSDYQPKVAAIQSRALDEAMDFAQQNPEFRFSTDGAWNVEQFWATRSPADQQRLVTSLRSGQISAPAEYANLLTGFPTAETLIRSLYPAANFSREHSTPFNYAEIADVPSYSWSYASVLASSGIKYFIAGPNGHETRAPVLLQGRLNEQSPFWWQGPDGKKVLFWYSRHYMEMEILFGRPPIVAAAYQTLPLFLQAYDKDTYHATSALMFGSQQENTDLFPQQAQFAHEWNSTYAYPRLEYAGFHDAVEKIADQLGSSIPTISGDGGPYWEDGIASDARSASVERDNESRGPAAEQLASITALVNPRLIADRPALTSMWRDMLLADEHTFTSHDASSDPGSDESIRQTAYKRQCVTDAARIADYIARNSMASIDEAIPVGHGSFVVFNTLNWKRSGSVRFDLHKGQKIVDSSTGGTVPVETLSEEQNLSHVRFVAKDVPATGYKVFTLQRGESPAQAPGQTSSNEIDSRFYRVRLDPATGSLLSIWDKEQNRELVDSQSPYRFGQYLYVAGGDQRPNSLLQYRYASMLPSLQVTGAHNGHLVSTQRAPDGWVIRMESEDVNTPRIDTEIRIFDNRKAIEFTEDIDKQAVRTREGIYFAFPFAMDHPQFQYEVQNGVVDPAKNMYPGAGHVWFSVQHWVSVQQDGLSATILPLDAGLVTLGDIHRGVWPDHFGDRRGTVFSFAMNNYWSTNYLAEQGGTIRLRYLVTSARSTDAPALSRLGWDFSTPLELDELTRQDKATIPESPLSATGQSFLSISDPDVLLSAWKSAEDGNGTIVRLIDLGGAPRQITVETPLLNLANVTRTDAVERDQSPLQVSGAHAFSFTIQPHEIVTVRMVGTDKLLPVDSASRSIAHFDRQ